MAREVELMSSWNPFISTGLTLHYSPPPDGSIRAYLQIQVRDTFFKHTNLSLKGNTNF